MSATRVNLIGKSNGVGLSRDLDLLADAMQRCDCEVTTRLIDAGDAKRRRSLLTQLGAQAGRALTKAARPPYDINLMLEHVWLQYLGEARYNVAIPNPEWFDRHDCRFVGALDGVWAKTADTQATFAALGCATQLIGFDSEDRLDASVAKQRTFFHLAGKSTMKGTEDLLDVWRQHPEWPRLVVVRHDKTGQAGGGIAGNVEERVGYFADSELRRMQNESMFHLCLSRTEGWGHYMVEAMSAGALTIATDAPPMNELVTAARGLLVPYTRSGMQRLAKTYYFDAVGLAAAVERACAMSDAEIAARTANARRWFVENKRGFAPRVEAAVSSLLQPQLVPSERVACR